MTYIPNLYEILSTNTGGGFFSTSNGGENFINVSIPISTGNVISLCAREVSGSSATVDSVLRMSEDW